VLEYLGVASPIVIDDVITELREPVKNRSRTTSSTK